MCGICGIVDPLAEAPPISEHALRSMVEVIRHRGPDDSGLHLGGGAAIGMSRLSIIDLQGSHQPLANEDQAVWTVFNGEIFNFPELRAELSARGHRFSTEGDTEVIVHLYEELGADFPKRLRGMFAIAVWDARERRLVLTRDRMGVKPLYFASLPNGLAFASEVKSLIAGGLINPALDPLAAELFLAYGYVPGPRTLFDGVSKLDPGCTLIWAPDARLEQRTYWPPWQSPPADVGQDWERDQAELLELLRRSVRERMISDVPLGVMLSGGLDSSLITALMAEESSSAVKTFSVGFAEDLAANELDDAREVAKRFGTDHHELMTSAVDHPGLLDEALWHLEEPIADLSCLGFLLLSRLARQTVTVALSGQGADELLGGYRKHQIAALAGATNRLPRAARALGASAGRLGPASSTAARGIVALTTDDPALRMLAMSRIVQARERESLLTPEFRQAGAEDEIRRAIERNLPAQALSPLGETLHLDTRLALVDNMFLYFDKMSMAASLEVRVPFEDHDLVAFCTALPDSRKVWRTRRKEILKRASRGLLDDHVIDKKKRGFFHSALGSWLRVHRNSLYEDLLHDDRVRRRGQFDVGEIERLVSAAGRKGKKSDQRLFSLMLLEKWQRFYVDSDGELARTLPKHRSLAEAS